MKYSTFDILKIFILMTSTVLLYLSIQELRVALGDSQVAAQTVPCSTPTPSNPPSATPSATPTPSPTPSPTPTATPVPPNTIFLTEFMACPSSGSEWLELYNASDSVIEVVGWQVIDASNNKKMLTGTIQPHAFTVFEWSGSLLNNAGDNFKVITNTGQVIAEASYNTCTPGISFVYEQGEWVGALESPAQQTEVSENTADTATISATTQKIADTTSLTPSEKNVFGTVLGNSNTFSKDTINKLPSLKNATQKTQPENPPTSTSQQPKPNTAPAISVILGGLLQLLPASYAFYDTFFKNSS